MRGRKPKPTKIHKLHGTYNATRHGRNRSRFASRQNGDLIAPPDWFTASQRDGWRYVVESAPPGLLQPLDRGLLQVWVLCRRSRAPSRDRAS
jgi:hypothetical protein